MSGELLASAVATIAHCTARRAAYSRTSVGDRIALEDFLDEQMKAPATLLRDLRPRVDLSALLVADAYKLAERVACVAVLAEHGATLDVLHCAFDASLTWLLTKLQFADEFADAPEPVDLRAMWSMPAAERDAVWRARLLAKPAAERVARAGEFASRDAVAANPFGWSMALCIHDRARYRDGSVSTSWIDNEIAALDALVGKAAR